MSIEAEGGGTDTKRMTRRHVLGLGVASAVVAVAAACSRGAGSSSPTTPEPGPAAEGDGEFAFTLTEAEWRERLTPAQFEVLRNQATEPPFTSPLDVEYRPGTFSCAGCGSALFSSDTKFDSWTGWPSFWAPLPDAVGERDDYSEGLIRTEVHCRRCGGHLGHVFPDGPPPTHLRYCINGLALTFAPST